MEYFPGGTALFGRVRLLIFGIFSRGYGLIWEGTFINFRIFSLVDFKSSKKGNNFVKWQWVDFLLIIPQDIWSHFNICPCPRDLTPFIWRNFQFNKSQKPSSDQIQTLFQSKKFRQMKGVEWNASFVRPFQTQYELS